MLQHYHIQHLKQDFFTMQISNPRGGENRQGFVMESTYSLDAYFLWKSEYLYLTIGHNKSDYEV